MVQEQLEELADEIFISDKSAIHEAISILEDGFVLRGRVQGNTVTMQKTDGVFRIVPEGSVEAHVELWFSDIEDLAGFREMRDAEDFGARLMGLVSDGRAGVEPLRPFIELWELGLGFFMASVGILTMPQDYSELISPLQLRDIAFSEILDVKYLQELVDELARITGVRLWILNMDSMPVVVSKTGGEHCQLIIDSLGGVVRCFDSAIEGMTELKRTMRPNIRICHAGFICFDAPLILGGEMVGMISGDASRTEAPDREAYRALAEELDIDPEPLLESLSRVRVLSDQEVEFLLSVVNAIAQVVMEMSYKQYRLSDLSKELSRKNIELKALFQANTEIQEREKTAIARDLHDDTGQNLTNALVNLEMALCEERLDEEGRNHIESAANSISAVLQQLHDLSTSLHPPLLDDLGLTEALRNLIKSMNADHNIDFKMFNWGEEGDLPSEVKINLYRIVQEAVSNIIKHSGASAAQVHLSRTDEGVDLIVLDNGGGFDGSERDDKVVHLGLVSMRERAERIGGTFSCPPSEQGVVVAVHVPGVGGG